MKNSCWICSTNHISAAILCCFWSTLQKHIVKKPNIVTTKISSLTNSTKSSPIRNAKASPYLTIHGPLEAADQELPKVVKSGNIGDKKSKFWFMKPGALNGALNTTSPYHTIQLGSQIPPSSSTKGKINMLKPLVSHSAQDSI